MAPPDEQPDDDVVVGDEVQWYRDPDGTEWFVDDGVRFELADDGFAYPVVGGSTDPTGSEPLEFEAVEDEAVEDEAVAAAADVDPADLDDTADGDDTTDGETAEPPDSDEPASPFAPAARDGQADDTANDAAAAIADDEATDDGATQQEEADGDAPPDATTRIVTVRSTGDDEPEEEEGEEHEPAWPATSDAAAASTNGEPLLDIRGLDAGYGSLPVLKDVGLTVKPGQTAVLLGLNGAGKTTTVSTVAGALQPWAGEILYDGQDVSGWNTRKAVSNGVVMVPEGRRVFPELSVGRNLQVGAWAKRDDSGYVADQRERVFDYFPRLREREDQLAGTLSGGEQQMLAVGRGLMADPRLLIIDEASMGLAPVIVQDVFDIVAQINEDGVTVLMVEQNVGVLEVADVGYVMEQGRIVRVLEGEELRDRSVVSEALMG